MNNQIQMLKLLGISALVPFKRQDGKEGVYYTAKFADPSNPFAPTRTRNFFQQPNTTTGEMEWKGADPAVIKNWINKEIPGYIANREVEPYTLKGSDGTERTVNYYTCIVLGHEQEAVVFRQQRHPLLEGTAATVTTNAPKADIIAPGVEDVAIVEAEEIPEQ